MKKIVLLLIALLSLNTLTFAAFPVTENSTTEILSVANNIDPVEPNIASTIWSGSPAFGILSLIFSVLAIFIFSAAIETGGPILVLGSLVLSILAVVFGGLGFNKSLKGFAITGFVLGCIELMAWLITLIAGTILFVSDAEITVY